MENNQNEQKSSEQMLQEILEYSRKTHTYMKWQFYITIVLVVLPILAMAFILPQVLKGLGGLGGAYLNGLQ